MGQAVGNVLPLALGVAISPIPIIAAILMLLSPRARSTGVGFGLGWLLGIVLALTVFVALAAVIPEPAADTSQPVVGVIKIVLGALMVLLALRQWRGRPHGDDTAAVPKWMSAIDAMTAPKAVGLGLLLSAVNPKNLLMAVGAGLSLGSADLSSGSLLVAGIVFVVIAASTVVVPVIAYLLASTLLTRPLESLRSWLVRENATVMAVLLLVIGVTLIGKGIGSF